MPTQRSKINQQAEKLVLQGKIEAAIQQYELLVKGNPLDMNTINKIGDLYSRLGRKREAIKQFNKIGEHYASEGFFLKAIAIYKKIIKLDPSSMDTFERLARLYKQQGLVTEARSQFTQFAQRCVDAGQVERAIGAYRNLLELEPGNAQTADLVVALLVQEGRESEAAEEYVRLAEALKSQGKEKEANAVLQKAARFQPASPGQALQLVRGMISSDDLDGALETIERALEGSGDHSDLLLMLCDVHLRKGESDRAEETILRCMRETPGRVEPRIKMAALQVSRGDVSKGFQAIGPHLEEISKAGAASAAADVLEEMHGLDDRHPEVLKGLISMHGTLQNADKQVEFEGKLLDLLIDQGEYADAQRIAESLVRSCPDDASLKERLELVRSACGNGGGEREGADQVQQAVTAVASGAEVPGEDDREDPVEVEEEPPRSLDQLKAEAAAEEERLDPEDEDFITEHMTEADVFVKYGLQDRAVEQLMAVVERFPAHIPAHLKLKEIHLEIGNREAACESMVQIARAHSRSGDTEAIAPVMEELRRLDPAAADSLAAEMNPGDAFEEPSAEVSEESAEPATDSVTEQDTAPEESVPGLEEQEFEIDLDESLEIEETEPGQVEAGSPDETDGEAGESADGEVAEPEESEHAEPTLSADLMDLASDIDAALRGDAEEGEAETAGSEATPEGQSLEEIVDAFKKGVEQQVDPDDFETHYNLGIAYKEMGLLDEAIGEFQFSAKGGDFLVDSCSMLGLCFTQKGMKSLAVKWYKRGLESAGDSEDETVLGMRYDLGVLLAEMGERNKALELFTEVYGVDSKYRDVAARIKQLQSATIGE